MDNQQDRQIRTYTDRELARRLAAFAIPHWRAVLLAVVTAGLLVAATLVQPLLIKIAIDDRIKGLHKPMAVMSGQDAATARAALVRDGFKLADEIEYEGRVYVRINAAPEGATLPAGIGKAHIDAMHRLKAGWPREDGSGGEAGDRAALGDAAPTDPDDRPVAAETGGTEDRFGLTADGFSLSETELREFRKSDYAGFMVLALWFLLAVVAAALLNYVQLNVLERTGQSIIFAIRERIFGHFARMHIGFFDSNPAGRLVTRVAHDVEALNQLYSQVIVNLIKDIVMIAGIVGLMLVLSVRLSLVSFAVIPLLFVVTIYFRRLVREAQRRARTILSRLNAFLAENLSGMHIIQVFNREEKQNEAFTAMNTDYYKAGMRGTMINSIFRPTIGLLGNVALAAVIWYGGRGVLESVVTFGTMVAFMQYVQQFYKPLQGVADRYNQIQTAMASAERVFDALDGKPAIALPAKPKSLPRPLAGIIEFDRVWFAYKREEWVLQDVSFRIEPGETAAFVGATGAGKTSVISLLNRFYDIRRGSVRIDGIDVREADLYDLRRRIGIIQQEAFVFTGDVYFNIRLHNGRITDEAIEAAASSLGMDGFIRKLPQGYRTPLGEQGFTLSSGQRQLLAFLRVYVNRPEILVLDEATANIDSETEMLVQRGLSRLSRGRTTLIVAHRLSTIRRADKIIVLSRGKIVEIGSHRELMARRGYYYRLYSLQSGKGGNSELIAEKPAAP